MTFTALLTELEDGVLTVTLNRPEKLNAFDAVMGAELIEMFNAADNNDDVRVIIITGAGRGFCAGADLSRGGATFDFETRPDKVELGSAVAADGSVDYSHPSVRDNGGRVTLRIFASLKPVIAAINGPAVGIGITMGLPMDVRLASETARFGFPFVRRGIVPEAASSWFLPRIVGISRAMEWCATGRIFGAQEALDHNLVRSIHSRDDLLPAARALALEMTQGTASVSVAMTRQLMWRGLTQAEPMDAHRIDSQCVYVRGRSPDAREGVGSFMEKRPADFSGKVSSDMPSFYPWWEPNAYS